MDVTGGEEKLGKFLTVKEARKLLNVQSDDTVRVLIHNGSVEAFKVGKGGKTSKWLIHKESLEKYIQESISQVLEGD